MDTKERIERLNKAVPGAVLESRPFSAKGDPSLWVEGSKLRKVCEALVADTAFGVDWLENLTVFQLDQTLILTLFFNHRRDVKSLIVRISLEIVHPDEWVEAPSVSESFPEGGAFEEELSELFGIRFVGGPSGQTRSRLSVLPESWQGFPLRKNYVYPADYLGIPHMRPVGRTVPDEYEVNQ